MLDAINEITYWHWIIFGLVLAVLEIFSLSFIMLWFGLGALAVGFLLLFIEISLTFQILLWVLLSGFTVYAWFQWVKPLFKTETLSGMSREKMLGQVGTVIELDLSRQGRGKLRFPSPILGDDEWQIISEDDLEVGCRVIVKEFSGNSLIVAKFK